MFERRLYEALYLGYVHVSRKYDKFDASDGYYRFSKVKNKRESNIQYEETKIHNKIFNCIYNTDSIYHFPYVYYIVLPIWEKYYFIR